MTIHVKGRHIGTDIFKPGERCQRNGSYRCENCMRAGTAKVVQVEEGAIFPMCSECSDWDMGWRPLPASAS
jgi:hypothetical protein